jgi:membrane-associated protein
MDWWDQLSATTWRFLENHGQLGAFLFLLIEEAGTPVPIPGDFLMVLVGAQAAQGRLNLLEVLAVMELATVLGACFLYWISARAGRRVVYRLGRHVGLTPPRLDRAAEELNRRGAWAVFVGRLTPGLRMATPIVCGVFRFPFLIYLPAMALGAFLYILFYTLLGYFFGPTMLHLLERLELPLGLIVSIIMLAAITFWVFRIGRRATPPQLCPDLRERLRAGAAGGLIATVTSALLANVLIHLSGLLAYLGPGIGLRRFLALLADGLGREGGPGTAVLLLPAFLIVGIGLGALYGGWLGNSGYVRGTLRGATFSLLPLCLALFILFPLIGAGVAGLDLRAGLIPALGESIRHLAYGLVLGTVYPALTRPRVGLGEPNPPAPFPAREGGDGVTEGVGERESSGGAYRLGGPNPPAPLPAREGGALV